MELVVASNNQGKIREYRDILEPLGFRVFSLEDKDMEIEVEETGATFAENAILKAQAIHERTHGWVLADDSGLSVEALNGEPGIYSARYQGLPTEHERRLAVLSGLEGEENRSDDTGEKHLFTGIWRGNIALAEEGTNGFGYDPIFISEDGDGRTTASMPLSFKETYSHRAKAVKQLTSYLNSLAEES